MSRPKKTADKLAADEARALLGGSPSKSRYSLVPRVARLVPKVAATRVTSSPSSKSPVRPVETLIHDQDTTKLSSRLPPDGVPLDFTQRVLAKTAITNAAYAAENRGGMRVDRIQVMDAKRALLRARFKRAVGDEVYSLLTGEVYPQGLEEAKVAFRDVVPRDLQMELLAFGAGMLRPDLRELLETRVDDALRFVLRSYEDAAPPRVIHAIEASEQNVLEQRGIIDSENALDEAISRGLRQEWISAVNENGYATAVDTDDYGNSRTIPDAFIIDPTDLPFNQLGEREWDHQFYDGVNLNVVGTRLWSKTVPTLKYVQHSYVDLYANSVNRYGRWHVFNNLPPGVFNASTDQVRTGPKIKLKGLEFRISIKLDTTINETLVGVSYLEWLDYFRVCVFYAGSNSFTNRNATPPNFLTGESDPGYQPLADYNNFFFSPLSASTSVSQQLTNFTNRANFLTLYDRTIGIPSTKLINYGQQVFLNNNTYHFNYYLDLEGLITKYGEALADYIVSGKLVMVVKNDNYSRSASWNEFSALYTADVSFRFTYYD